MSNKGIPLFKLILGAILVVILLVVAFSTMDRNMEGHYVVRQKMSGEVDVISKPVFFWALGAKTWTYPVSFEVFLSSSTNDGGDDATTQAVKVIFNDGSYADLSSNTKVTVPADDVLRIRIHTDFKSAQNFQANVRRYVEAVLKRSGSLFKAEEAYASQRTQLENIIAGQIENGKYKTEPSVDMVDTGEVDAKGEPVLVKETRTIVALDENSSPVIEDIGFIRQYDLTFNYFNLTDVDPDSKTLETIEKKKQADMDRLLAQTEAEKAKQDAITAEEQGKADIAKEKAAQEVIKTREVTQAEKAKAVAELKAQQELEVARLNKQAESENAEAKLIVERAEAEANRLKVQAGLTPQQQAEWNYKTTVDSVKALASGIGDADFPEVVIMGGDGSGGGSNVLDTVAINQTLEIIEKMGQ